MHGMAGPCTVGTQIRSGVSSAHVKCCLFVHGDWLGRLFVDAFLKLDFFVDEGCHVLVRTLINMELSAQTVYIKLHDARNYRLARFTSQASGH